MSTRVKLMRKFAEVIREQEDRGIGTGLQRKVRWMDYQEVVPKKAGNAANAEQAAKRASSEVCIDLIIQNCLFELAVRE